jgi:hypothetical protein
MSSSRHAISKQAAAYRMNIAAGPGVNPLSMPQGMTIESEQQHIIAGVNRY